MDPAPPTHCDVLSEWRPAPAAIVLTLSSRRGDLLAEPLRFVMIPRPKIPELPQFETVISSSTGVDAVSRAADVGDMPFPLKGGVSDAIAKDLTVQATEARTILWGFPPRR